MGVKGQLHYYFERKKRSTRVRKSRHQAMISTEMIHVTVERVHLQSTSLREEWIKYIADEVCKITTYP